MTVEERGADPDRFEQELVVRLDARAGAVRGRAPLAALRHAGRRRKRRRVAGQLAVALAVVVLGIGAVARLDAGVWTDGRGALPAGPGETLPDTLTGEVLLCGGGPAVPRWRPWAGGAPSTAQTLSFPTLARATREGYRAPDLLEIVNTVRRIGAMQYGDNFFGACYDGRTSVVFAQRVAGSGFDQAVNRAVTSDTTVVQFVDALGSRRHFVELQRRIMAEAGYWSAQGVTIDRVAISEDGAGVFVYTEQAATAVDAVAARYGPEILGVWAQE
ncbi:hypothetical protein ACFCX4_35745 [Kitasatospora sp. NPDC056327]|uniref:hypothetical protein n=1 Tax=Kitasatospora sp. NPDC056327 TaxID=3345785 RepID=UPI0035E2D657